MRTGRVVGAHVACAGVMFALVGAGCRSRSDKPDPAAKPAAPPAPKLAPDAGVPAATPRVVPPLPGLAWITPHEPYRLPLQPKAVALDGDTVLVAGYFGWIARVDLRSGEIVEERNLGAIDVDHLLRIDAREWLATGTSGETAAAMSLDADTLAPTPVPLGVTASANRSYHTSAARLPDGTVVIAGPGLPLATYDPVTWQVRDVLDRDLDWEGALVRDGHVIGVKTTTAFEFDPMSHDRTELGVAGDVIAAGSYSARNIAKTALKVNRGPNNVVFTTPELVEHAAFDDAGTRIVTVSQGIATIRALPDGQVLGKFDLGYAGRAITAQVALDDRHLVLVGRTAMRVVDLASGTISSEGAPPYSWSNDVRVDNEGAVLAIDDGAYRFLAGKRTQTAAVGTQWWLSGPKGELDKVGTISDDDRSTITLRDATSGDALASWTSPQSGLDGWFGSDGTVIFEATSDYSGRYRPQALLRSRGRALVPIARLNEDANILTGDADTGVALVEENGDVRAISLRDGKLAKPVMRAPECGYAEATLETRGTRALVFEGTDALLWDRTTGRLLGSLRLPESLWEAKFVPGHSELLLISGRKLVSWRFDTSELRTIELHAPASVDVSPDARWLGLGYADGRVSLVALDELRAAMTATGAVAAPVPETCPGGDPLKFGRDEQDQIDGKY